MDKQHSPEPPDDRAPLAPADPPLAEASRILGISLRLTYRLIERGELETYVLGRRRVTAASIRLFRAKCLAAGARLQPVVAKRPRGRPRKPRPEEHPQAPAGRAEVEAFKDRMIAMQDIESATRERAKMSKFENPERVLAKLSTRAEFEIRARRLDFLSHRRGLAAEGRRGPGQAAPTGPEGARRQRPRHRSRRRRRSSARTATASSRTTKTASLGRHRVSSAPVQHLSTAGLDQAVADADAGRTRQWAARCCRCGSRIGWLPRCHDGQQADRAAT